MTNEGEDLRRVLVGAGLNPAALARVPEPSDEGAVWLLHTDSPDWLATWQTLRKLLPQTHRWPLAVTNVQAGWNQPPSPGGRDLRPGRVMRRLTLVDVSALLDEIERDSLRETLGEWLDFHLEATEELCGQAPTVADIQAAVGDAAVEMAVERWLLSWERTHRPDARFEGHATYLNWYESDAEVMLLLLPRPEPWSAAVYVGHDGSDWPDSDIRPALIRHWSTQYGAEPVANWATMQQCVIRRPPTTLDEAWKVARAQALLWPDTCSLPGVTVRQLARDLLDREQWFLHLRP